MELRRVSLIEKNMFRRNGSGTGKYVLNKYQLNIILLELLVKGIYPHVPVKPKSAVELQTKVQSSKPPPIYTKHLNKKKVQYKINRADIPHLLSAIKMK